MKKFLDLSNIKGDLFGGVTAGIVALPLALAFGVQSGMGAIAGLYGAIVLGVLAAIFGGTATQISGPTGPMTVVSTTAIAAAIAMAGTLENAMPIIIGSFLVAGLLQIVLGLIRVGKYIKYIPYPVLSGFMTGIGVIIIILQIFPALGHGNEGRSIAAIFADIAQPLATINWAAVGLAGLTIAVIYVFPRITKVVPSTLIALLVVTVISLFIPWDVPVIGDIPSGLPDLQIGGLFSIDKEAWQLIIEYGVSLGLLGVIDSLLTSVIADNVTKTKHNSNRELIGQGIGNMAAALIGGLPGAGATMRTVVNVNAGGRTRISGVVHGLLLVAILLGLGKYAAYIPMPVLAGILITVGFGIIDYKGLKSIHLVPRSESVILLIVLAVTVFGDLIWAVGTGMVLSVMVLMKKMSDSAEKGAESVAINKFNKELPWEDEGAVAKEIADKIYVKHLDGPLFFGFEKLAELIKTLPSVEIVIIRMEKVPYMDQSGLYALEESILALEQKGIIVCITGLQKQPEAMMRRLGVIPLLVDETYIFESFNLCAEWLHQAFKEGGGFEMLHADNDEIKKAKISYRM